MVEKPSAPEAGQALFGFERLGAAEHAERVRGVFASVAGRYDLMNDLMSGGLHRLWKASMIDWLAPRAGWTVIDVAGGTGDVADAILRRVEADVIVCDPSLEMLNAGIDRMLDRGRISGIRFVAGRAEALPFPPAAADACTIAFGLRNVTDRAAALSEARRVLRPGGRLLCLEFSRPVAAALRPLYDAYSLPASCPVSERRWPATETPIAIWWRAFAPSRTRKPWRRSFAPPGSGSSATAI